MAAGYVIRSMSNLPSPIHEAIALAWADDVSFDDIEKRLGLTEGEVIRIMRGHLKAGSFRVWRARVSGRKAKHSKLMRKSGRFRPPQADDLNDIS
jgi:uncharacterized protein (TIGR03643 family)